MNMAFTIRKKKNAIVVRLPDSRKTVARLRPKRDKTGAKTGNKKRHNGLAFFETVFAGANGTGNVRRETGKAGKREEPLVSRKEKIAFTFILVLVIALALLIVGINRKERALQIQAMDLTNQRSRLINRTSKLGQEIGTLKSPSLIRQKAKARGMHMPRRDQMRNIR